MIVSPEMLDSLLAHISRVTNNFPIGRPSYANFKFLFPFIFIFNFFAL
jgi:hypothetical protein